jgi:hypothetical protein
MVYEHHLIIDMSRSRHINWRPGTLRPHRMKKEELWRIWMLIFWIIFRGIFKKVPQSIGSILSKESDIFASSDSFNCFQLLKTKAIVTRIACDLLYMDTKKKKKKNARHFLLLFLIFGLDLSCISDQTTKNLTEEICVQDSQIAGFLAMDVCFSDSMISEKEEWIDSMPGQVNSLILSRSAV